MASKLHFHQPAYGMDFIWNVSQHVGDDASCPNQPNDVNLVKIIMIESMLPNPPHWIHPSLRVPFVMDGRMDMCLAYWIRTLFDKAEIRLAFRDAGIISPAHAPHYGSATWGIVWLNSMLHSIAPAVWQDLTNSGHMTPDLRRELLAAS